MSVFSLSKNISPRDRLSSPAGGCSPVSPAEADRIHRGAKHLQRLGPRAVAELLLELAAKPCGPAPVLEALDGYRRLSRHQIIMAGAERPLRRRLVAVP
jgi:hypothetical protein